MDLVEAELLATAAAERTSILAAWSTEEAPPAALTVRAAMASLAACAAVAAPPLAEHGLARTRHLAGGATAVASTRRGFGSGGQYAMG
jgi:hypothetical protein